MTEEKGKTNKGEREFETGMDEYFKTHAMLVATNAKRTYDEYQDLALTVARNMNSLTVQVMQNAIETANMAAKQAVRHADIAIDRQWNVDEQGWSVVKIMEALQNIVDSAKAE